MRATTPALLLSVVSLALPATALAQSAGDEQYADPFGGSKKTQQAPAKSQSQQQTQGNQQTAQSNPGADPTPPTAAPAAQSAAKPGTGKQLPYTGLPAGVIAALGLVTLLAGIALRSALKPLVPSLLGRAPTTLGRDVLLTPRSRKR